MEMLYVNEVKTSSNLDALRRIGVTDDADLLAMVDASLDCIKIVEPDGRLSFVSENGLCMLEIDSFDDIGGKLWSDLWPAEAQGLIEEAVDRAMSGEPVRLEAFCPTAMGRPRWWDVSVSPMIVDGETKRLLSISRDITDRVRREQRAAERERLAIVELERAKRKLGEAMPERREFLSRVGTGPTAGRKALPTNLDLGSGEDSLASMIRGATPGDRRETLRLRALDRLAVMDTQGNPQLDRLTELAAQLLDVPTALVSLVDSERQWFKSRVGMDLCETPRGQSFCSIAIQNPDAPFIIEDATKDPRTADNPLVTGDGGIRAYLGIPLVTSDGHALGAFCVIDTVPRTFDEGHIATLKTLARSVISEIEREHLDRRATRLDLINAELKHRMGNTYAQVSSLVGLLAGSAKDKASLASALRENITALSRTQARIAQGGWASLDLCSLVKETLRASEPESRIDCDIDPNFDIAPQAAFMLTLALQELATNSRKHGILRGTELRVKLHIKTTDERLVLDWMEDGVNTTKETRKPLAKTPSSGFGQKLLNRIVPLGLGGSSMMELYEDGMHYRLDLPRERIAAD